MSPAELRREAMRVLRDLSPNITLACELLAQAEAEDEREMRIRREMQQLCEPEIWAGCQCQELHPVAKHGAAGAGRGKAKIKSDDSSSLMTESFADNTARKLGTSEAAE